MHNCSDCGGSCTACQSCGHANELLLTEEEIEFLRLLGQVAFLPVARKMGDLDPVYLEEGEGGKGPPEPGPAVSRKEGRGES